MLVVTLEKLRLRRRMLLSVICGLCLAGCGDDPMNGTGGSAGLGGGGSGGEGGTVTAIENFVVTAEWVRDALGDDAMDIQLVDTRDGGYETGHIPGAVPLTPLLLASTVDGIAAQISPPIEAQPVLRALGLRNDATIVVYGAPPEFDPARVMWALSYYMHDEVRYLDGGYAAWLSIGGEVEMGDAVVESSEYTIAGTNDALHTTGDAVLAIIGERPYDMPSAQLVDARSPGEWEAFGFIPTASLVQWTTNLDNGFLKTPADVAALYPGLAAGTPTVTYCLAGWRASFTWLSLTWLGFEDVAVYDGSWNEWGTNPGMYPIALLSGDGG